MEIPCWDELVQYGAGEIIQREYGNYITDTEPDYAISLKIDIDSVPPLGGKQHQMPSSIAPPQPPPTPRLVRLAGPGQAQWPR